MSLSLPLILGLAAADAVNPCALAVLTLVLVSVLTHNPKNRRKVLLTGITFTVTVFFMYLIYGLILIHFFQSILNIISSIQPLLYDAVGLLAITLGILNIKDGISYGAGGFVMEVPRTWRPNMKKLIASVTSPRGAVYIGIFVTLFLLPCTIGPYIVATGVLSSLTQLLLSLPWLILYNIIFVLPMLAITIAIYFGLSTVENISDWKELNIKKLHLIAGIIMILIGVFLVMF
jgi:cytochrome c biogenesis protein CcdA